DRRDDLVARCRRRRRGRLLPVDVSHGGQRPAGAADAEPADVVHELPQADLVRRADARARPRELPERPADPLEPRLRSARLRLLRPLDPREQGRRLRDLSRPRRRDAAPLAGELAVHELVPPLSRGARALRPPARARLRARLAADGGSGGARPPPRRRVRDHGPRAPDELLRLSPMSVAASAMSEIDAVRTRLAGARGALWWRTLEEVADSDAFAALVAREMPAAASLWLDPIRRRSFLKLMAAALALGGLGGCPERPPAEPIVPYVHAPETPVAGPPVSYATAMPSVAGL